jgi:hypothetical protein
MTQSQLIVIRCFRPLILAILVASMPNLAVAQNPGFVRASISGTSQGAARVAAWRLVEPPAVRTSRFLLPSTWAEVRIDEWDEQSGPGGQNQPAARPKKGKGAAKTLTFAGLTTMAGGAALLAVGLSGPSPCPTFANAFGCAGRKVERWTGTTFLTAGSAAFTVGIVRWIRK